MLEEGGWRGAQRVFVWSFYSQGTDENRQGDADPFYIAALTFFGFEREAAEAEARKAAGRAPTQKEIEDAQRALIRRELPSPAEKGRALARLVRDAPHAAVPRRPGAAAISGRAQFRRQRGAAPASPAR